MYMIDWFWGLAGGLLIGSGSAIYLLGTGRIAGISGIAAGVLRGERGMAAPGFLIGLVLGALVFALVSGPPSIGLTPSLPLLTVAGLLVGFATQLGNGCTSGHGVCGLSRLSRRSLAATAVFMVTAAATVFITRHLIGG